MLIDKCRGYHVWYKFRIKSDSQWIILSQKFKTINGHKIHLANSVSVWAHNNGIKVYNYFQFYLHGDTDTVIRLTEELQVESKLKNSFYR